MKVMVTDCRRHEDVVGAVAPARFPIGVIESDLETQRKIAGPYEEESRMFELNRKCRAIVVLSSLLWALPAVSQTWPVKPVRVIVPFPPGATLDTMARLVTQKASESTGQPFVVENRAGANGMIGSEFVSKSAPDGYTLLATTTSTHISAPYLVKKLPYDPRKDVTPITAAVDAVTVVAVSSTVPVNSAKELVEYLKKSPGKITYGTPGVGNAFHLVGEIFQSSQGVSLLHVPYKGIVQAVQAAATGEVSVVFSSVNNTLPHMKSGRLKVLAVINPQRWSVLPDLPAIGETLSGFTRPDSWFGFLGPANIPAPVVDRVNAELVKALKSPDLTPKFDAMGLIVIGNTPAEFLKMYMAGFEVYAKIIKAAGIQPE
jgi:tripartite-type tricarboxylate transporter receptor subunit TctC